LLPAACQHGTTHNFCRNCISKPRPKSGLDCLICAEVARRASFSWMASSSSLLPAAWCRVQGSGLRAWASRSVVYFLLDMISKGKRENKPRTVKPQPCVVSRSPERASRCTPRARCTRERVPPLSEAATSSTGLGTFSWKPAPDYVHVCLICAEFARQ